MDSKIFKAYTGKENIMAIENQPASCILDDKIDEPAPCVYGPDPECDEDLDTCVPEENDIVEKKDAQE